MPTFESPLLRTVKVTENFGLGQHEFYCRMGTSCYDSTNLEMELINGLFDLHRKRRVATQSRTPEGAG